MKSRPILFSTEMVEAIKAGRKSQTRRVIELSPYNDTENYLFDREVLQFNGEAGATYRGKLEQEKVQYFVKFPFGVIGDELYVREKWRISDWDFEDNTFTVEFVDGEKRVCELRENDSKAFNPDWLMSHLISLSEKGVYEFKTKGDKCWFVPTGKPIPWRPSIYMPKEAARFALEIINVRVERLHDISEEDAVAEGIEVIGTSPDESSVYKHYSKVFHNNEWWNAPFTSYPTTSFISLWGSIHGTPTQNTWVWVIEFKRKEVSDG